MRQQPTTSGNSAQAANQDHTKCNPSARAALLQHLVQGILPDELILEILATLVRAQLPLYTNPHASITTAATLLLAPPLPEVTSPLIPLMEQTILKTSTFTSMIRFQRDGPSTTLKLPPTFRPKTHQIRHLQLKFTYALTASPMDRALYPSQLLQATRGMSALAQTFSRLESLHIVLDLETTFSGLDVVAVLGGEVRSGWLSSKSWREVVVDLIAAVKSRGPGRVKELTLRVLCEEMDVVGRTVVIDGRGAGEVLDEVVGVVLALGRT